MNEPDFHCRKCHQVDEVRKVSIVVEEDVRVVHGEYGTYRYPTDHAKALARPEEPKRKTSAGCGFVLGIILLLFGGVGLFAGTNSERALSIFFLILGVLVCIIGFSADSRDHKEYKDMLARWPKAAEKWDQLYYCRRCGVFFDPNDHISGYMPATRENMLDHIYKKSSSPQKSMPPQENEERKVIIRCENCKQKLLIPLRRKNIHVTCPKCRHEFNYEYIEGEPVDG